MADFPNVIYLLAMDREVVRRALTDVHNIDGNEYLEKIIQVPFELPELKKSKLHNIFLNKLDQIINDFSDKVVWDTDYWSSVFRNCVEPYINTLRDVNRMINTFQFRYGMLYKEIALEDMVGMTTLEVLEPELYKWICNNKEVYNMIQGFDKSKLNQFTDIEQIKLASFVLNYNKNEMDHVDEQEVLNLISEWKTGKEE